MSHSPRRRVGGTVGAAVAALALLAAGAQPVLAQWTDVEVGASTATAGSVTAPVGTTCVRQTNNTQALFSWSQAATGLPRDGYFVGVYAVGGTAPIVSATLAANRVSVTVTAGSTFAANTTYELRLSATSGTWSSAVAVGTFRTGATNSTIAACSW